MRHHYHLLLRPNAQAGTHFAILQRVAGRVNPDTAGKGAAARALSCDPQQTWPAGAPRPGCGYQTTAFRVGVIYAKG